MDAINLSMKRFLILIISIFSINCFGAGATVSSNNGLATNLTVYGGSFSGDGRNLSNVFTAQVVIEGDSVYSLTNSSSGSNTWLSMGGAKRVAAFYGSTNVVALGVPGKDIPTMINEYTNLVRPYANPYRQNILMLDGGYNDMHTNSLTDLTNAYVNYSNLLSMAKADNFFIVAATLQYAPANVNSVEWTNYNALILGLTNLWNVIVRPDIYPVPTFDGTHHTAKGALEYADMIMAAITIGTTKLHADSIVVSNIINTPFITVSSNIVWAGSLSYNGLQGGNTGVPIAIANGNNLDFQWSTKSDGYRWQLGTSAKVYFNNFSTDNGFFDGAGNFVVTTLGVRGAAISSSIVGTNFLALATNYIAANFAPAVGQVKIVSSNNWLYTVTETRTNALLQIAP